jgi:hypothetical protein
MSFSRLGSEWIDYKFTPEDYVASDDKVVAYGTYTGTYTNVQVNHLHRQSGSRIWKLKDSKIVQF